LLVRRENIQLQSISDHAHNSQEIKIFSTRSSFSGIASLQQILPVKPTFEYNRDWSFFQQKKNSKRMSKLKLFVSHSSKTVQNVAFLERVCQTLGEQDTGFHVLVDQSGKIPAGEEWFRYLSEWMAECDAAVILFSRAAFEESEWVRAEAAILSWRKRIQPKFKLVGVLLDDVNPTEFDTDVFFKVIRISDFQFVRDCENEQAILSELKKAFGDLNEPPESPFEHLSTLMREILATIQDDALKRTWDHLQGIDKPHWEPELDFSESLARLLFREPEISVSNMRIIVEQLANVLNKDKAMKMLELVKGLWVNAEAASTLAWIRENSKAAMINGEVVHDFTGQSYIRRSWPFPEDYKLLSADKCRSLKEITTILLAPFSKTAGEHHAQRRLQKYKQPLFLVFPFSSESETETSDPYPDADLVGKIIQTHPNVTVVVSTGVQMPNNLQYLEPVIPQIAEGRELDQFDLHCDLFEYISESQPAG